MSWWRVQQTLKELMGFAVFWFGSNDPGYVVLLGMRTSE